MLKHASVCLILVSEPRKFMRNENRQAARLYLVVRYGVDCCLFNSAAS